MVFFHFFAATGRKLLGAKKNIENSSRAEFDGNKFRVYLHFHAFIDKEVKIKSRKLGGISKGLKSSGKGNLKADLAD